MCGPSATAELLVVRDADDGGGTSLFMQNAFELYGADFMIAENYTPWLLEMNSSPGMAPTSLEKTKLCAAVMHDTFKGDSATFHC